MHDLHIILILVRRFFLIQCIQVLGVTQRAVLLFIKYFLLIFYTCYNIIQIFLQSHTFRWYGIRTKGNIDVCIHNIIVHCPYFYCGEWRSLFYELPCTKLGNMCFAQYVAMYDTSQCSRKLQGENQSKRESKTRFHASQANSLAI